MNPRYGKIFQKIRLQRNFTLDDFKALGISKASLSKFENNHNTISVERVNSALQEMNITLKEYEYFLNDFSHEFHEEVFQLIEESQYKGNFETLQLIEKDCLEQEQYLLSLAAKSSYGFLTFDEQEEIVDYLESLEKWSFFDISLLTFTVKNFRDTFIIEIMDIFWEKNGSYKNIFEYRRRIHQATHRSIYVLINRRNKRYAKMLLTKIKQELSDTDIFAKIMNQFIVGCYTYQFENKVEGEHLIQLALRLFQDTGSHVYYGFYKKLYQDFIRKNG